MLAFLEGLRKGELHSHRVVLVEQLLVQEFFFVPGFVKEIGQVAAVFVRPGGVEDQERNALRQLAKF